MRWTGESAQPPDRCRPSTWAPRPPCGRPERGGRCAPDSRDRAAAASRARPATRRSTATCSTSRARPTRASACCRRRAATPRSRSGASTPPSGICPASRRTCRCSASAPSRSTCARCCSARTCSTWAAAACSTCSRSGARTGSTRSCARRGSAASCCAGISAGSMCWFEAGVTTSLGRPRPVRGLGLLPGSNSVHYDSEPARRPCFHEAIRTEAVPPGWAVDDGAGLLFAGRELVEAVSARRRRRRLLGRGDARRGRGDAARRARPARPRGAGAADAALDPRVARGAGAAPVRSHACRRRSHASNGMEIAYERMGDPLEPAAAAGHGAGHAADPLGPRAVRDARRAAAST